MGDFNSSLFIDESTASSSTVDIAMRDFRECVEWKCLIFKARDYTLLGIKNREVVMGDLHANVTRLRNDLDAVQTSLDTDPFNVALREKEATCIVEFNNAVLMEERFLKQKSRVSRSRIDVITNSEGIIFENDMVPNAFVEHYELFLGQAGNVDHFNSTNLFKVRLNDQDALDMVRDVSNQEVKNTIFSMGDDKSSCPDGFTAAFFKEAWNVIAIDVTHAVHEFFINGTLLKEINHTIIALLLKVKSPFRVNDYQPISCCNMLFKCISKIIANRIKHGLKTIISSNQSAFVPSWSITDNILLTQELMHNYHLDRGSPRVKGVSVKEIRCRNYASIIKEALDEFKNALGLAPSLLKSTAYFCNVLNHVKLSILQVLPFEEGTLSVKYLSVPLVSSCLMIRDCNELIDKVQIRIQDWKNKALLIAGRLQLIQSVLGLMHIYWALVFILPTRVLLNIEQLLRQFLWFHGSSRKGKSKVAWESVCLPKDEGDLGIRRLECFNAALMASHIWKIINLKESLWVKWIYKYKLKEPIGCLVSNSKVHDVIIEGTWLWSHDLIAKFSVLNDYNVPINDEEVDRLVWHDSHGNVKKILVSQVWADIRMCDSKMNWYNMVWFPSCIPRHAINLWLIIRRKLKTQDLIPVWDVSSSLGMVCSLCESNLDSHDHLFFECPVACGIWNRVKGLAGLNALNSNIYDIIQDLLPIVKRRTTVNVIAKLVVAASAYYVWQEKNWRLFKKGKRNSDQIVECIVSFVRLKLLSCKLKKSKSSERMARFWDLPEVVFI
nr:reverse transcriptase domain, reverse transcriptase zinc-binding domain protein [Tanacetum cinerariifolium]